MPQAHIHVSNAPEALADALAEAVAAARAGLGPVDAAFRGTTIVAPGRAVEGFLRRHLASRLGVAANLEITFFTAFLGRVVEASAPEVRVLDRRALQGLLLERLHDEAALERDELEPVRRYLYAAGSSPDAVDRRRLQLSVRLARLFGEYGLGPSGLAAQAPAAGWQRALWEDVFGPEGLASRPPDAGPRRWLTLPAFFAEAEARPGALRVPPAVHVFAPPPGLRLLPRVLPLLASAADLHVYHLQPCREHEDDFEPAARGKLPRGRFRPRGGARQQLSLVAGHDPSELADPQDPLPVRAWAGADRELLRQIERALPGAAYHPRFVAPAARGGLLAGLQRAVLDRSARPAGGPAAHADPDPTVTVLACTGVRRELETIAAEIWRALRAGDDPGDPAAGGAPGAAAPLRFDDIAVIVPPADAETYTTHACAVFREAGEIPFQILDTSLGRASRLVEAVDLLLALPLGGFTRAEILRLVTHPSVMARFPEARAQDWIAFCERLGIFHGADRLDHADTYVDGDLFNWDQGVRRLVLGALLGEAPGSPPFEVAGARYAPVALAEDERERALAFALLVRSLITDARAAARARLRLPEHVALMRALVTTYLLPAGAEDERALAAFLGELGRLAEMPVTAPVSYRIASELARRALATLTGGHASHVTRGVTLSTYLPARGLPFRLVFLAGLGAGRFPSADVDDELDARPRRRAPGDVPAAAQDRGLFLSVLGAARDRVVLSYVARDGQTGDELEPSTLLRELGDFVAADVTPGRRLLAEARRPPLWRHEDDGARAALATADAEHRAVRLGRALGAAAAPPPAVAAFLGMTDRAPADAPGAPRGQDRRRLGLTALRRFLECPLQGSAAVRLGLREADAAPEALLREDEPFETERPVRVELLRRAFVRALGGLGDGAAEALSPRGLRAAYEAVLEPLRLTGTVPTGVFGEAEIGRELETLLAWAEGFDKLLAGAGRPRVSQLHFGGRPPDGEAGVVADAIELRAAPGRAFGPHTAVEIVGSTSPLLSWPDGSCASLVLTASRPRPSRDVADQREALRGLLDHLARAAARDPGAPPEPHRVFVLRPPTSGSGEKAQPELRLPAIDAAGARAELAGLAEELLGRVHAYLLPCEAVFQARRAPGKPFDQVLADLRDGPFPSYSSRFGPVPHPETYPPPPDAEARALIARRFRAFFGA